MDQTNRVDQVYRLLALCARAEGHSIFYERLARQTGEFTAWSELPAQAEKHGMAPLLWRHLRQAQISIPRETEQILSGLYLRQRAFNQTYAHVLIEMNALFEQAGIRPLLLKGLALAYQYYPDPALRPISDIDLLFKKEEVLPAMDILVRAGFHANYPRLATAPFIPKELSADSTPRNGIRVHVELHHYDAKGKYEKGNSPDPEFQGFHEQPQTVWIEKNPIRTSAPIETLHFLSTHLVKHLFIGNDVNLARLKWTADIVSLVEFHAETLDWKKLQKERRDILNRLEVFYSLTPLPERLVGVIPIKQVEPPRGLNQYPPGWPHHDFQQSKRVGLLKFLWLAFVPPSDWWLCLYYGIKKQRVVWYKHIIYRVNVFSSAFWTVIHKMGF